MKCVVWLAAKSAAFQLEIYYLQEHMFQSGKIVTWFESTPDWIYNRPTSKHCLNLDIESPEKYFFDQKYISGKVEIQNTTEVPNQRWLFRSWQKSNTSFSHTCQDFCKKGSNPKILLEVEMIVRQVCSCHCHLDLFLILYLSRSTKILGRQCCLMIAWKLILKFRI